jgi:hypothetical protein
MKKLKDKVYELGIEQTACKDQLEAANLMNRILSEMGHDQSIRQLHAERGYSG